MVEVFEKVAFCAHFLLSQHLGMHAGTDCEPPSLVTWSATSFLFQGKDLKAASICCPSGMPRWVLVFLICNLNRENRIALPNMDLNIQKVVRKSILVI